jgi:predicted XRE-type DNA-binding protein
VDWSKLGKKRSKFGQWIDSHGLSQSDIVDMTGVSRRTINELANDDSRDIRWDTRKKIMDAVNEIDEDKTTRDFWEW